MSKALALALLLTACRGDRGNQQAVSRAPADAAPAPAPAPAIVDGMPNAAAYRAVAAQVRASCEAAPHHGDPAFDALVAPTVAQGFEDLLEDDPDAAVEVYAATSELLGAYAPCASPVEALEVVATALEHGPALLAFANTIGSQTTDPAERAKYAEMVRGLMKSYDDMLVEIVRLVLDPSTTLDRVTPTIARIAQATSSLVTVAPPGLLTHAAGHVQRTVESLADPRRRAILAWLDDALTPARAK